MSKVWGVVWHLIFSSVLCKSGRILQLEKMLSLIHFKMPLLSSKTQTLCLKLELTRILKRKKNNGMYFTTKIVLTYCEKKMF